MKRPLYDAKGQAVAYIAEDGERTVCLWNGAIVAYIDDWLNCYGWNGTCLGWFENGTLYDTQGQAVGFLRPRQLRPPQVEPVQGPKLVKRPKAAKRPPCPRPEGRTANCRTALEDFLRAGALEGTGAAGEGYSG